MSAGLKGSVPRYRSDSRRVESGTELGSIVAADWPLTSMADEARIRSMDNMVGCGLDGGLVAVKVITNWNK